MDSLRVCNAVDDDVVLDYFAGSGSTGHAVLNLNRADDGNRKYILVEMGEYFNTVTLPRMKKVIYSADWKGGKPQNRNTGVSHVMKYITLESYEDALSNIELSDDMRQLTILLDEENRLAYMLNHMLGLESRDSLLNLDAFALPFTYKLKINENNETKDKAVDLPETFNYLLGLSVVRQSAISRFSATPLTETEWKREDLYEGSVRLERDTDGEFSFKQIEGKLPDGKRALVIWRTMTNDLLRSNAALDAYFVKNRINPADREFDLIFVNGDNNLENLRFDEENWKVQRIEPVFKRKMFEGAK
jgi:adenine-specific DNA-methyltransferase